MENKSLQLLASIKLKSVYSFIFEKSKTARIRNITTFLFISLLVFAAYLFFYNFLFKYVISLEEIGYLLIERLLSVGFLAFFFMIIISSFVVGISSLFRSQETEYLFSMPIQPVNVFLSKFIDILIYSSWSILVMALPILYSYAKIRNFGILEYTLTGIAVIIPFVLLAVSLGTTLVLVLLSALRRFSIKNIILTSLLFFLAFLFIIQKFSQPNQLVIPFTDDFRGMNLFINNFKLNSHPFTPNFWLIQSLRALVIHDYKDFFLYSGTLVSNAFFFFMLMYYIAEKTFFNTWVANSTRIKSTVTQKFALKTLNLSFFKTKSKNSQIYSLLVKDITLLMRDSRQWSQIFLLLTLTIVYFINLSFVPKDIEIEQWRTIIALMNIGFCGFLLATFSLRFVYPSISLEGKSIWIITSAPLSPETLFRAKFWSSFTFFLFLTEIIAVVAGIILRLEPLYQLITIFSIFLMSVSLSCIAVGFGAAFPDFTEKNPSRIASSPGGIVTVLTSLFYISLMLLIISIPCYKYTTYLVSGGHFPLQTILFSFLGALLLNLFFIILPVWQGIRIFSKKEF